MDTPARTKLVADVALYHRRKVLLVRYADVRRYDGQKGWFLPDDYLRRLEHPEDAALRILKEQVGIELPSLDLGFIESFEGNGAWHIVFHFTGHLEDPSQVVSGTNTAAAKWFDVSELPARPDVAHHGWALDVIEALEKPRVQSAHTRSLVD